MRTFCIKNVLVVGVILLFISIAFQPAIAVNPISSDNEEDCDICPKVSKTHLVRLKSLINRVETIKNKLLPMSKYNTKFVEKYQELSDRLWSFPISCSILLIFAIILANIADVLYNLPRQPWKVITTLAAGFIVIGILGNGIGCWDFQWVYPPEP
jgi:hypothetical protein